MQPRFRAVRAVPRLAGLVLAAAFGVGCVLSFGADEFGVALRHEPDVVIAVVVTGFGFAGVLIAAPFVLASRLRTLPGLLVAGVAVTVLSVVWYAWLLMHIDSSTAAIGSACEPVYLARRNGCRRRMGGVRHPSTG